MAARAGPTGLDEDVAVPRRRRRQPLERRRGDAVERALRVAERAVGGLDHAVQLAVGAHRRGHVDRADDLGEEVIARVGRRRDHLLVAPPGGLEGALRRQEPEPRARRDPFGQVVGDHGPSLDDVALRQPAPEDGTDRDGLEQVPQPIGGDRLDRLHHGRGRGDRGWCGHRRRRRAGLAVEPPPGASTTQHRQRDEHQQPVAAAEARASVAVRRDPSPARGHPFGAAPPGHPARPIFVRSAAAVSSGFTKYPLR